MADRHTSRVIALLAIPFALLHTTSLWGQLRIEPTAKSLESIAPSPPMGWNSWNFFGKFKINETVVIEVIDAIARSGLRDAGYKYVVVDGGWRDAKLGPGGELLPHPERFPHGMKRLADYAHSRGVKFGLHTVPGTADCIGDPVGGYGREEIHVQQLVDWGVDFVKLDKCRFEGDWTEDILRKTYSKWGQLLKKMSARPIVFSISAYETRDWYPKTCQMARTTEDISAKVAGMSGCQAVFDEPIPRAINKWGMLNVMEIAEINNKSADMARKGYWNDPDMLVTGDQGLTDEEQKSHFALWCIMSAPLMLGNDPRNMTPQEQAIILNGDAISIDQDPTEQGKRVSKDGAQEVWVKHLANGDLAVLLLNRNKEKREHISIDRKTVGVDSSVRVKDVYAKKDIDSARSSLSFDVAPKSSLFLLLSK